VQLSFHFKIRDEVGSNEGDTLFVARVLFPKSAISFLSKIRDEVGLNKDGVSLLYKNRSSRIRDEPWSIKWDFSLQCKIECLSEWLSITVKTYITSTSTKQDHYPRVRSPAKTSTSATN